MRGHNFTERVRQALAAARHEADRLRHEYVGTEHLLLGLIASSRADGRVTDILARRGVSPEDLRAAVEAKMPPGRSAPPARSELPYTSRAKRVLELTMDEAAALRADAVDVEHLLLGVRAEDRGIAAQMLAAAGLDLSTLRDDVRQLTLASTAPPRPGLFRRLLSWIRTRTR
ncbi:MAG: Clp protease N-terminal domain-containing protein [Gemmatimonadaceae bacterium]